MELLADENVEMGWIQALGDDGHDIIRVVDVDELGASASYPDVFRVTAERNRVPLTADRSDFSAPPTADPSGINIIAAVTRTGGEVRHRTRYFVTS